jgi:hypothetical protein
MTQYEFYALLLAGMSFIVAGIALGWNIFRDCINRPKLKIDIFLANVYFPQGKLPDVISIHITNVGKQPINIKAHGFQMKDKTTAIFPEIMGAFDMKCLEPYGRLDVTASNEVLKELVKHAHKMRAFLVSDTSGKTWKSGRRCFNALKKNLTMQQDKQD